MYSLSRELLDLFNYSDYLHNLQVWDLSVRHLLRRHVPYRLQGSEFQWNMRPRVPCYMQHLQRSRT